MDMVIPFQICLKCVPCVKKIMVCRFLIFPLTIENDEFVLCQSAFAAFQVPIDVQISESHPRSKNKILQFHCIEIVPYLVCSSFHVLRICMRKIPEDANHEDFLHL